MGKRKIIGSEVSAYWIVKKRVGRDYLLENKYNHNEIIINQKTLCRCLDGKTEVSKIIYRRIKQ